jgi:hypothetical protein
VEARHALERPVVGGETSIECQCVGGDEQVVSTKRAALAFHPISQMSVDQIGRRRERLDVDRAKDRFDRGRQTRRALARGAMAQLRRDHDADRHRRGDLRDPPRDRAARRTHQGGNDIGVQHHGVHSATPPGASSSMVGNASSADSGCSAARTAKSLAALLEARRPTGDGAPVSCRSCRPLGRCVEGRRARTPLWPSRQTPLRRRIRVSENGHGGRSGGVICRS